MKNWNCWSYWTTARRHSDYLSLEDEGLRYIQELTEGERFSQVYLCKNKITATTKSGKNYYSLNLQDKTGQIDGKIWDLSSGIDHFETGDFIQVDGEVTAFNNTLQLNIRRVRKAREGEYDPKDYFPVSPYDVKEMYDELMSLVSKVKNEKMRQLIKSFFVEDPEFIKAFKEHSAAKSVHHGFIGGLLQHTLSVVRLCYFYCSYYPALNRDLLLTAALFHDVGKLKELSDFPSNDYTDDGQLLGHIMIGAEMVGDRIRQIPGFPERTAVELKHCILAHHGELEYGSPKKPALIEALALNFADNTDAKLETMTEALNGANGTEWMGFNRLLDSNIRRTTPLEK